MKTDIMKNISTIDMAEQYQRVRDNVSQAIELLAESKSILKTTFGDYRDSVLPTRFTDYTLASPDCLQDVLDGITRNAWRGVVDKSEIRKILSEARHKELGELLDTGTLPEFTAENMIGFLENLRGNAGDYFKEAVCEVFDFLRPRQSEYKTNTEYEIGKKAILNYMIDYSRYGDSEFVSLNYRRDQEILALDNVFHMLDGKGSPKYPGDAITKIKESMSSSPRRWECETPYFNFRWHKKGSLHVTFKRLDLVKKLNAIAGGNRLKNVA